MHRWPIVLLAVLEMVPLAPSHAAESIGVAVTVKNEVAGKLGEVERRLATGDEVFSNETIAVEADSAGEFQFKDDSKLALGPGATIVLDEFVYQGSESAAGFTVDLVKGAFRFITGKLDHKAYAIKTPLANLAVRGTVFDVYVGEDGETAVLLHEGGVQVCNASGKCREHRKTGYIVHVGRGGVLSAPIRWTGRLFGGIGIDRAFPFLRTRLVVDPVERATGVVTTVAKPVVRTGKKVVRATTRGVRKAGRTVRRVLRRPRLPF